MFAFTPTQLNQCLERAKFNVMAKRYHRDSYTFKLSCGLYITACNDGSMLVRTIAPQTWNEDDHRRLMAFLPSNTIWRIKTALPMSSTGSTQSNASELPLPTRRLRVFKGDNYENTLKEFMEYEVPDNDLPSHQKPATPRKPVEAKPYDPKDEQW
jgi:predicted metalloprotease with PDZ domain